MLDQNIEHRQSQPDLRRVGVAALISAPPIQRVDHMLDMQGSAVRLEAGQHVLWVQGKGRSEADAFVVLVPAALDPVQAWRAVAGLPDESPLFPCCSPQNRGGHMTSRSISRIVKDAMRRAGIDSCRLTPHSLRHTAISLAISGGASLAQAQAMARHSSPNTTMVYFHNVHRVRDAAERCVNF